MKLGIIAAVCGLAVAAISPVQAAETVVGAWRVGIDMNGDPYMLTDNDSGGSFGRACDMEASACFWIMLGKTSCKQGTAAPVLLSIGSGVESVELVCSTPVKLGTSLLYRYVFKEPKRMTALVPESDAIGIAMAVDGGGFRVFRFATLGAAEALESWRSQVASALRRTPKSTKDLLL